MGTGTYAAGNLGLEGIVAGREAGHGGGGAVGGGGSR